MAKASVKQRAPAKRAAAPSKPAAKSAAKAPSAAKAAPKGKAAARKPAPASKKPLAKASPAKKPAAKPAKVAKLARAVKAVTTKSAVPAKVAATKAAPAAKVTAQGKTQPAPKAAPAKAAPVAKSVAPVVAKPAVAPSKAAPAPVAKPTEAAVVAKAAEPAEAPKPSGRPMLSQGPFVSTALTKRGTFAPNKLLVPAPKPRRPIERPAAPAAPVPPPPPPAPMVMTGEKAHKNRAGLSPKDLDFFRDLLLAKRRELLGDMNSMEREALREGNSDLSTLPIHMADQGTDAYEQEFTLGLVEKDRTLLREINNALAKIQNGTYGICEGTGLPISKPRLEAQPWAKYSIEHARALEKRQMMFRR